MRTLYTLLLLLFLAGQSAAQTSIGLRAAYGNSRLSSTSEVALVDNFSDASSALSFGIVLEQTVHPYVSLRSGVEINRRGTILQLKEPVTIFGMAVPEGGWAKTRYTYIDLPLLIRIGIPVKGVVQPFAYGGTAIGYAIKGNVRTTAPLESDFQLATAEIDLGASAYERFHAAAVAAVGLDVRLRDDLRLFAEGRYERSLTKPYRARAGGKLRGFEGLNFGGGVKLTL